MRKSALRPALAVIAAVVATAMSAPSAYAVHYKVRITGAGRVYDHLEQKRLDCSSPISTPQGQLGRDCDTVDYPNAWSITPPAARPDELRVPRRDDVVA